MILLVDAVLANDSSIHANARRTRRLGKSSALWAKVIDIEVISLSTIVALYISHDKVR